MPRVGESRTAGQFGWDESRELFGRNGDASGDLAAEVVQNTPRAIAVLNVPGFRFVQHNRSFRELAGRELPEGSPVAEVLPELAPDLLPFLQLTVDTGRRTTVLDHELRLRRRAQGAVETVNLSLHIAPLHREGARPSLVVVYAEDTTARVRERRRAETVAAVAQWLNAHRDLKEIIAYAVTRLTGLLGGQHGAIFLFDPDGRRLRGFHELSASGRELLIDINLFPDSRRAVDTGAPVRIFPNATGPVERRWMRRLNLAEAIAVPLIANDQCPGLLFVGFRDAPSTLLEADFEFAQLIAGQCALALQRAREEEQYRTALAAAQRARAAAELARERAAVLAALGEALIEPRGKGHIASRLAPLLVPRLADLVLLDLNEPAWGQRTWAACTPEIADAFGDQAGQLPLPGSLAARRFNLAEGGPVTLKQIRRSALGGLLAGVRLSVVGERRAEVGTPPPAGPFSATLAPLSLRGKTLGTLLLVHGDRPAEDDDRTFAVEFANRCALSIEAARQRAEAEQAVARLTRGEAVFRGMAASRVIGFALWKDEVLVDANDTLLTMLGFKADDLQGGRIRWPLEGAAPPPEGGASSTYDVEFIRADGTRRMLLVAPAQVEAPDLGGIALVVDISERHRTREYQRRVIGVVSHDLRSPLMAAQLLAESIARAPTLPPRQKSQAAHISRIAARMSGLVRDLLDFTRSQLGAFPVTRCHLDLADVINPLVAEFQAANPDRPIEVDCAAGIAGSWDPDRLQQALGNLLSNAFQYSPPGTAVRVVVQPEAAGLAVSITNAGTPIPARDLQVIFEPFRQLAGGSSVDRNLGLGLFIAREIIEAHGGRITVASTAEAGTTFTVHLPREGERGEG